jgi:hypothetical protein
MNIALALATVLYLASAPSSTGAAIGAWLPNPDTGFDAWSKKQAMVIKGYDYFVCGSSAKPTVPTHDFSYAGSVCPPLKSGTAFVYGGGEPISGKVVYDGAHSVALYYKGCCAWRGFALSSALGPPPKPVAVADLSGVHTMRGVSLGMTQKQLVHIYGAASPHAAKGRPGLTTVSYTTMTHGPNDAGGEACGQFQSFTFKTDNLVSIELLAGC